MTRERTPTERATTKPSSRKGAGQKFSIFSDGYAGPFQDAMNDLFSVDNVAATAKKIIALEKTYGQFEVGKFNRYLIDENTMPPAFFQNGGWDKFERDFGQMPADLRNEVSATLRANFYSSNPLPVVYQTSINVTPTHDALVKSFSAGGVMYIGVLYLCPNPRAPQ